MKAAEKRKGGDAGADRSHTNGKACRLAAYKAPNLCLGSAVHPLIKPCPHNFLVGSNGIRLMELASTFLSLTMSLSLRIMRSASWSRHCQSPEAAKVEVSERG